MEMAMIKKEEPALEREATKGTKQMIFGTNV